ncbi:MAG: SRPBCC domain-containing protein [Phycisphaerales bacterium]|nr:SRPBCC domain-containing protein [Phycisphaerales bacterium]
MAEATAGTVQKVFKIMIRADIHDVWREITRRDAPIKCFFNSRMDTGDLAAGSRMAMRTPDGKYTGVVGEILEVQPPRRFAHTFQFTRLDDPPCKVVYELTPVEGGTEFIMRIEDLVPGSMMDKQMSQGAKLIMGTLKHVMETGRPSMGVRMLFVLFKMLQPIMPKRCLSERWPV